MKAEKRRKKLVHILDTAYWLFLEGGFEQTTVEQIAKEAGISKPTLYKYVRTKDEILHLFHVLSHEDVESRVRQNLEEGNAQMALWIGISGIHELVLDMDKDMFSRFISHALETDYSFYRFDSPLEELCIQAIAVLQEEGTIQNACSPRELYRMLAHLDQGMIMDWCRTTEEEDLHERFKEVYTSVLGYQNPENFDFPLCSIKKIDPEDACPRRACQSCWKEEETGSAVAMPEPLL